MIVEGQARPFSPTRGVTAQIVRTFGHKYDGYQADRAEWTDGALYRVQPSVVFAWRDMPTATCWRFR